MLYAILAIVIVLSILVFVHELGHFLAAKLFGVRVERFSIGFPPRLFGIKIGETDYCISATPLGGYVKLSGMIDESMDAEQLNTPPKPYEFRAKPVYQQVIIITAGVIMNFLLAVGILGGMFWVQGEPIDPTTRVGIVAEGSIADSLGIQPGDVIREINGARPQTWQEVHALFMNNVGDHTEIVLERDGQIRQIDLSWDHLKLNDLERLGLYPHLDATVGQLSPGYPAEEAGLQRGDRILTINGTPITSWYDMTEIISTNPEHPLPIQVLRGSDTLQITLTPRAVSYEDADGTEKTRGVIGIAPYREVKKIAFLPAMARGFEQAISLGQLNVKGFTRILSGKDSAKESLAGPIRIAKMAGDIAEQSFWALLPFIAYLSVVLAIINILPIPALDGGHLMIILIEGIRRKPLSLRTKMMVQQIGMALLLMLIVYVLYNDIININAQ